MAKGIADNGSWLIDDSNTNEHCFDYTLCKSIIEFILENKFTTLYDLGCGLGNYVSKIKNKGLIIDGFDGNPYTEDITNGLCKVLDLSQPQEFMQRDCTISLEVGEHIPKKFEHIYLDNLCKSSKNIIISWAVEGQNGYGHVNCQNNDYIVNCMRLRGYNINNEISQKLRTESSLSWFKNTLMYFYV
jgi:hypothetical protein